jgi:hypothetical protein
MVIRCNGGDTGRGRHSRSLIMPDTMTPNARRLTSARPNFSWSHQNSTGRKIMKKVCVPRFATTAKYESSSGLRMSCWSRARGGVSSRTRGRRDWRMM